MPEFKFITTVDCETQDQAETVMGARLGPDEDYGFDYTVDYHDEPTPKMPRTPKTRPVCYHCGSINVKRDAWATWNPNTDSFSDVDSHFDQTWCDNCDGESDTVRVPYNAEYEDAEVYPIEQEKKQNA